MTADPPPISFLNLFQESCPRELITRVVRRERNNMLFQRKRIESYVLVLYTGGTIGMMRNEHNAYVPATNILEKYIRRIPYMHDDEYASTELSGDDRDKYLVFPEMSDKTRILYHIEEYSPLLDSSNMGMDNWIRIGIDIKHEIVKNERGGGTCTCKSLIKEKRILVIYTGGTIGMKPNADDVLVPVPNAMENFLRHLPYFNDAKYDRKHLTYEEQMRYLVYPATVESHNILYEINEYSPLLDSSNMTLDNWIKISSDVKNAYEAYDGFVILHGTDTLAYTASALSFMFENIGKTVIVTGSQIPVFESRSDGRDNILGSLVLAANFIIPEVTVFFQQKLYRGNRIMKKSTDAFHAFDSPNMAPLAKFGINIEVDFKSIFRPHTIEKFNVHSSLNPNVGLLRLFPNITIQAVKTYLQPPVEGVVIQTYGAGNIPSNRTDILDELRAASKRDVIIVNCTQCMEGSVVAAYETGMVLSEVGVIPGSDMTPEAALTKLSYVLSKTEWDIDTKRKMMQQNLRGELTPEDKEESGLDENNILKMEDESKLKEIMLPALFSYYIIEGDVEALKAMKKINANFCIENSDFRTPLHVACCEGNEEIIEYLLLNGASVHAKDRFDNTPLMDAIYFDNHRVIKILVQCGAHLALNQSTCIGEKLCSAAARGDLKRLQSFELAGANLSQSDFSGNTALHLASLHGNEKIVAYLVSMNVDVTAKNMLGYTPADIAEKLNNQNILQLLHK